jgi:vitamin B12 transporter
LRLLRRPQHSYNASVDWEAVKDVKLGATVHGVSSSEDFGVTLNGYTLVGLRASVAIGEHYELYGRVENLFDEKYEMVSGYGTLGRAAFVGVRAKL